MARRSSNPPRAAVALRGRREIWHPVPFTPADAYAAKAVEKGAASPEMQRRFFDWLLTATRMRDEIFVPGQEDVRSYLLGRRSVGLQIAALLQWREGDGEASSGDRA